MLAQMVSSAYVPGTEHVFRVVIDGERMALDGWRPRYRSVGGPHGLAWDACLSGDAVWLMDNGDCPPCVISTPQPEWPVRHASGSLVAATGAMGWATAAAPS